jgi:hypothetical protein
MKEIWKRKDREGEGWEIGIRKVFLRRENTSIGRKETKEGAEWGERERECGMDVAKWEKGGKRTERNTEQRRWRKGDKRHGSGGKG